ncbi:MAG: hypothetical protein V4719_03630 [Planctomycetota bacterium]
MSQTLQERFSFVAFGPFGPVYIQFDWEEVRSGRWADHRDQPKLSANGWPVQRIARGKYQVMEPGGCVEVVSSDPCAP